MRRLVLLALSLGAIASCADPTGPLENTEFWLQSIEGKAGPPWQIGLSGCSSSMIKDVFLAFPDRHTAILSYNCTAPSGHEEKDGTYTTSGADISGGFLQGSEHQSGAVSFTGTFASDRSSVTLVIHEWGDLRLTFAPCPTCTQ